MIAPRVAQGNRIWILLCLHVGLTPKHPIHKGQQSHEYND